MNEIKQAIAYLESIANAAKNSKGKDRAKNAICEKVIKTNNLAVQALKEKLERENP